MLESKKTSATLLSDDSQPLKVATGRVKLRQSILNYPSEESRDGSTQQMTSSSAFALPCAQHREIVVGVHGGWSLASHCHRMITFACSSCIGVVDFHDFHFQSHPAVEDVDHDCKI